MGLSSALAISKRGKTSNIYKCIKMYRNVSKCIKICSEIQNFRFEMGLLSALAISKRGKTSDIYCDVNQINVSQCNKI